MNTSLSAVSTKAESVSARATPHRGLQRKCACGRHTVAGEECEECRQTEGKPQRQLERHPDAIGERGVSLGVIQRMLAVGSSDDPLEREADHVAEQVTTAGYCPAADRALPVMRRATDAGGGAPAEAPVSVERVLARPGRPLDASVARDMSRYFGHDFSHVRVHTDAAAARSTREVDAQAYTVGQNVVFGAGRFAPSTHEGRRLLAHELTHVVQQCGWDDIHGTHRNTGHRVVTLAAPPMISRASPDAVGHTMGLGRAARTGLQFSPTNVTDTRVGPVTVQGGLMNGGASRLNVIIGANMTMRTLAAELLPLWVTATPFTPPGAGAPLPLDIITQEELARGLLVYNDTYLAVPALTIWRSGLRLPLPAEIDEVTGVATLHPLQIRALASGFDPAWAPLLDLRAPATAAVPIATLRADVAAFLAREPTASARGIHLGARALTNAVAELPFTRETFRQLGAASFDVALAIMDNLVNREISLLASQRAGAAILAEVRTALAAGPRAPSAAQRASLARANRMLGVAAGVVAQDAPGGARSGLEKTITVDTVKLDGSSHDPATDVAMANAIFAQCNVRVQHGVNATATHAETIAWLRGDTELRSANNCAAPGPEERALFRGAPARFGFGARFRAFFVDTLRGVNGSGFSCIPSDSPTALMRNTVVVVNDGDTDTLAHELGHILINLGPHASVGLMSPRPALPAWRLDQLSDAHCTRLYRNA